MLLPSSSCCWSARRCCSCRNTLPNQSHSTFFPWSVWPWPFRRSAGDHPPANRQWPSIVSLLCHLKFTWFPSIESISNESIAIEVSKLVDVLLEGIHWWSRPVLRQKVNKMKRLHYPFFTLSTFFQLLLFSFSQTKLRILCYFSLHRCKGY